MGLRVSIRKRLGDFTLESEFETDKGVLGLLGPSGCGKSLTLKCIAGIERPDQGRIELNGVTLFDSKKKIDLPPQERNVGYLFQNYALFPHMTLRQNILCGMRREKDPSVREQRLRETLSLLGLEGLEDLRPWQLSGGQAQRTALARILVSRPRLLMLDEPFSALDSHLREKLQMEMKELLEAYGDQVLLVTHSRDEVYHLCSSTAVMDSGRLLSVKPTKQLFADPGTVQAAAVTGCKNIAPAKKAGPYEVEVPDWGVRFQTAKEVGDGLRAVGIRAHYFSPGARQNRFPIRLVGEMEEPFEWVLQFRWAGQASDSPALWWRLPKDRRPQSPPDGLGIAPVNVLLLY